MIIEIKGIPDQKIKNINFNIEFLDDSDEIVKISQSTKNIEKDEIKIQNIEQIKSDDIDIDNREPKEIPKEMTDMEF